MKENALTEAENLAAEGNLEVAISILTRAQEAIRPDAELSAKRAELVSAYRDCIYEDAEKAFQGEGLTAAVAVIDRGIIVIGDKNAQLSSLRSDYQGKYRDTVILEAEKALKAEGYQAAIEILNDGLRSLPNDASIQAKISCLEAYRPVLIDTLYCQARDNDGNGFARETEIVDIYGVTHEGLIFSAEGYTLTVFSTNRSWEQYLTDGKYSKLEGLIVLPSGQYTTDDTSDIRVEGDGVELYRCTVGGAFAPTSFQVDITNVKELRIIIEGRWGYMVPSCFPRIVNLSVSK